MKRVVQHLNERGAALVEFAIVLPLLLLLAFGIIEFGFLLYNKAMLTNASREGAREGILFNSDRPSATLQSDVLAKVGAYCQTRMIPKTGVPTTTVVSGGCLTSAVNERAGKPLVVNVTFAYPFIVFPNIAKMFGSSTLGSSLTLNAESTMRCE